MNPNWKKIWSKRHSIRLSEAWCYGAFRFAQFHGVPFPKQKIEIVDSFGVGYVDEEEYARTLSHFVGRIKREGFDAVLGTVEDEYREFLDYAKSLDQKPLTTMEQSELAELFDEFLSKEDHWMHFMWPVFALDEGLTPEFENYAGTLDDATREQVQAVVLTPHKQTAAGQYHTDILQLLASKGDPQARKAHIAELARRYAYFPVLNMDEEELSVADVEVTVAQLEAEAVHPKERLEKERREEEERKAAFDVLVASLPPEQKNLLIATNRIGYLREYRNDVRQEAYLHARELYREIGKRMGLGLDEVIYCTRDELRTFLAGSVAFPSHEQLADRRVYSLLVCDNVSVVYSWTRERPQAQEVSETISEFKGTIAYKGKVSGTVRVILDVEREGSAFKEGEILVTTTTNLSFVPLMGKAKAIITEEGGLLTHTAIVARELKVPCIIGTKIATKALKNGDLVEVDAEKGIVRKL